MIRWLMKLQTFDFTISPRAGKKHKDADAMSSLPFFPDEDEPCHVDEDCQVFMISTSIAIVSEQREPLIATNGRNAPNGARPLNQDLEIQVEL